MHDSFSGTWKLNVDASTLPFAPPRAVEVVIAADEASISMTEISIAADGAPETVRLSARFDDQYYPVLGSRHIDRFAIRRVDTHTLNSRATRAGRPVSTAVLVLARDGHRLTEEVETTLADGTRARATLVFDRAR